MEVKYNRNEELENVKHLDITIGDHTYRISESVDQKMTINKQTNSDSAEEALMVFPRYANQVDIK